VHIVDTQNNFFRISKRNFLREERKLGLWVGQIIALPAKIRRWLIQLYLAYISDNKLIIYRCKRGFFGGVCIEKGALGLLWAKSKRWTDNKISYQCGTLIRNSVISVANTDNRFYANTNLKLLQCISHAGQ